MSLTEILLIILIVSQWVWVAIMAAQTFRINRLIWAWNEFIHSLDEVDERRSE